MRQREQPGGARGHLLIPAMALLAAIAFSIPGSLSQEAGAGAAAVATISADRDLTPLRDLALQPAPCLVEALRRTDRLSGIVIGSLYQLSRSLDRLSRDVDGLVGRVEVLMSQDGLEGFDAILDEVAGWFADTFELPAAAPDCAHPTSTNEEAEAPCHA